jgi:hypothetical protein
VLSKDLLRFVKNRYPGSVTCCFIDGIVVKNKLFFCFKTCILSYLVEERKEGKKGIEGRRRRKRECE